MSILELHEQQPPEGGIFLPAHQIDRAKHALQCYDEVHVDSMLASIEQTSVDASLAALALDIDGEAILNYVYQKAAPYTEQREIVFSALAKLYADGHTGEEYKSAYKESVNKLRIMYRGRETTGSTNARDRQQVIGFACLMHYLDDAIPPWLPAEKVTPESESAIAYAEQLKHDEGRQYDVVSYVQITAFRLQYELAKTAVKYGFEGWRIHGRHYELTRYPLGNTPYLCTYDATTESTVHFTVADLAVVGGAVRGARTEDCSQFLQDCIAADAMIR